jgi:hypothetical protein
MNRDGQMHQILTTEYPQYSMNLKSVAYQDGLPAAAKWVREGILAKYQTSSTTSTAKKTASKGKAASGAKKEATKKVVAKSVAKSKSSAKSKKR